MKYSKRLHLEYGSFQIIDKIFGRTTGFRLSKQWRKSFYRRIGAMLYDRGPARNITIEKLDLCSETFNQSYLRKNKPVVFKGAAEHWPCCKQWSLEYLKELHGDDQIVLSGDSHLESPFELHTLRHVIDNIENGGDKYYRFYPLLKRHPEHYADFDINWLHKMRHRGRAEAFQVFLGGKERYTPLHAAIASNFFIQVTGKKHWKLYDISNTMIIDPNPGHNFHRSAPHRKREGPFNPFWPNYEYPYHLFEYADVYEVVLEPGDILYNPPYFWHAVRNLSTSIGVGYRWIDWTSIFRATPLYAILDLMQLNPPIWKIWKEQMGDYNELHLKELGVYENYLEAKKHFSRDKRN